MSMDNETLQDIFVQQYCDDVNTMREDEEINLCVKKNEGFICHDLNQLKQAKNLAEHKTRLVKAEARTRLQMSERIFNNSAEAFTRKNNYFDHSVVAEKNHAWINYIPREYPQMFIGGLQEDSVDDQEKITQPSQYPTYFSASQLFEKCEDTNKIICELDINLDYGLHAQQHVAALDFKKQIKLALDRAYTTSRLVYRKRLTTVKLSFHILVGDVTYNEEGQKTFVNVREINEMTQTRLFIIEKALSCVPFDSRNPRVFVDQLLIAVERCAAAVMMKKTYEIHGAFNNDRMISHAIDMSGFFEG